MISSAVVDEPELGTNFGLFCSKVDASSLYPRNSIKRLLNPCQHRGAGHCPSISRVKIEEFVSFCRLIWKIIYLIAGEFTS
jgi:hypothetical protein